MLSPGSGIEDYRVFRRDFDAQRPAVLAVARRHGLAASELRPFAHGTHLVWGTDRLVVKIFAPLWPDDSRVETALLGHVSGTGLPAPQLEAVGEIHGWPYVVMNRLPGEPIGEAWPGLDPPERERLALKLGELMGRIAALPTRGLENLAIAQDALVAERLARLADDQRARGADARLVGELMAFACAIPPLTTARSVLLHADVTNDNVLVSGGEITGLIDFADAFVGPWTYELAAPSCGLTRGDAGCRRALLSGLGVEPTPDLAQAVRVWAVLHRYAHVATMMTEAGETSFEEWLNDVWSAGGGTP